MTCPAYPDGKHRLTTCDDPLCCTRGYVEVCICGARLGNEGRKRRRAISRMTDRIADSLQHLEAALKASKT